MWLYMFEYKYVERGVVSGVRVSNGVNGMVLFK